MEFRTWDQLTVVEQLQSNYSDFYKDVHGFRPRFATTEQWNSQEWLEAQMVQLEKEYAVVSASEKEIEAIVVKAFENSIALTIVAGAGDRETAIKWLFQAENDSFMEADPDYYCYTYGLPYGYFRKTA